MSALKQDVIHSLIDEVNFPVVFRSFVANWELSQWSVEKWCSVFGDREIPFRCMKKDCISDEPCWERRCTVRNMTFKNFVDRLQTSAEWMYFDYKYLHQWFSNDSELCKELSWKSFGFSDKGAPDTTLWVGSDCAHTPAHQDTYGVNIIAQVMGKKRWILFPPDTDGLKPTRVPYEESSVYSELNFFCPANLDAFKGLSGARVVDLCAGDALLVPRGWWHYVQNTDPLNIALNVWLPHEKDSSARVSEALIKILVAQVCKDLPQETVTQVVNPNEDDISDMPLAALFLQLETVLASYLESRHQASRAKRRKTTDDQCTKENEIKTKENFDLNALLEHEANNLGKPKVVTNEELLAILKENIDRFASHRETDVDDDVPPRLSLTKAVLEAFSETNVIELVKQNLIKRLNR